MKNTITILLFLIVLKSATAGSSINFKVTNIQFSAGASESYIQKTKSDLLGSACEVYIYDSSLKFKTKVDETIMDKSGNEDIYIFKDKYDTATLEFSKILGYYESATLKISNSKDATKDVTITLRR